MSNANNLNRVYLKLEGADGRVWTVCMPTRYARRDPKDRARLSITNHGRAWWRGLQARMSGKDRTHCPYRGATRQSRGYRNAWWRGADDAWAEEMSSAKRYS